MWLRGNVNLVNNDLPYQIVPRKSLRKVTEFGGFSSHIKKVINFQGACEQIPSSPLPSRPRRLRAPQQKLPATQQLRRLRVDRVRK